ncbi:MAG: hypothetical protein Ct9H90mP27_7620 [Gammaproteobacteria bacterium]|nr:MAG: hypothetical protein Ct9H90mP27_7620 [Gammaproteobacteria bacterium]
MVFLRNGYITGSSPPIVVKDTVIVGNSAEQGYNQSRIKNIPGDILAYDKRTGAFKWKFNVIPKPGEYGMKLGKMMPGNGQAMFLLGPQYLQILKMILSTFPNPMAQPSTTMVVSDLVITYLEQVIALRASTGERAWHFQTVHHDIWNYDNPMAPVLLDLDVPGQGEVPAVMQVTKQSFVYAFNRLTGEPIWPIIERPVPQSTFRVKSF